MTKHCRHMGAPFAVSRSRVFHAFRKRRTFSLLGWTWPTLQAVWRIRGLVEFETIQGVPAARLLQLSFC